MNQEVDLSRLVDQQNVWFATVRQDGRPHLVPIWFIWTNGRFYICISKKSIKSKNMSTNHLVSLALEDGRHPLIVEGSATSIAYPWPDKIIDLFKQKYNWDIQADSDYDQLVEISPTKWLSW